MSSHYSSEEDNDGSKQRWITDTHEARRDAIEIRREIPPELVHTPPYDVPQLVDYYNRLIHEYAGQIRPKADSLETVHHEEGERQTLWNEVVESVEVPASGTLQVGRANIFGEFEADGLIAELPTETREISLANLRQDWRRNNRVRYTVQAISPDGTPVTETKTKVLTLPVYACDALFDQLNECLEDLGWLPKASVKDIEATEVLK